MEKKVNLKDIRKENAKSLLFNYGLLLCVITMLTFLVALGYSFRGDVKEITMKLVYPVLIISLFVLPFVLYLWGFYNKKSLKKYIDKEIKHQKELMGSGLPEVKTLNYKEEIKNLLKIKESFS